MDQRVQEVIERLSEVGDEELEVVEEILRADLESAAESKDVDSARLLAEAIDKVRAESRQRAELARQREQEITEIMSRVHAQSDTEDGDEDENGEGDDAEGEGTGEGSDTPADAPVTTSASTRDRPLPKIGDLVRAKKVAAAGQGMNSRTRERSPDRRSGSTVVVAASDVPGLSAGTEIADRKMLRHAIKERYLSLAGSRTSGRIPVAKVQMIYPEDRILRSGDEEGNADKLANLLGPQALVASGGICAPPAGFYDTNTLATGVRPLRDSLPVFGAERGGIRFIRSVSLLDIGTTAISVVTSAQDAADTSKTCLTIDCESVQETTVQAIARCLQFGNFNARTHPEYITHLTDLTIAAHARRAEQELWESMCDASTAVTAAENLSAWRDLYASVGRAAAMFRSRHRMSPEAVLRLVVPFWLADMLSIDLVRQAPGDNTVIGVARTAFASALAANLNVRVTWTMEGGNDAPTQIFGAQGAGPLDGWPDTVEGLLFPEGTFLYLDGGTLDLGVVRDSTLNATNDFQLFAETFEAVAFLGPEALCLTMDLCPSGLAAGHDDSPMNCAVGVSS